MISLFIGDIYRYIDHLVTCHEGRDGSGVIDVLILNLSAGWGWMINTMPWPLYLWKGFPVPTVQESGWASGPVWMVVEERKFLAPTGVQTPNCPAHSKLLLTLYTLENISVASVISSYLQISATCNISKLSELIMYTFSCSMSLQAPV